MPLRTEEFNGRKGIRGKGMEGQMRYWNKIEQQQPGDTRMPLRTEGFNGRKGIQGKGIEGQMRYWNRRKSWNL